MFILDAKVGYSDNLTRIGLNKECKLILVDVLEKLMEKYKDETPNPSHRYETFTDSSGTQNDKPDNTQNNTGNTSNNTNNNNSSENSGKDDTPTSPTLEDMLNRPNLGPGGSIYGPSSGSSTSASDSSNGSQSNNTQGNENNSTSSTDSNTGTNNSNHNFGSGTNNSYNPVTPPETGNEINTDVEVTCEKVTEKLSNLQWTFLDVGDGISIVAVIAPEGCPKKYLQPGQAYSWEAAGIKYSWDGQKSITATYETFVATGSLGAPPEPTPTVPTDPSASSPVPTGPVPSIEGEDDPAFIDPDYFEKIEQENK